MRMLRRLVPALVLVLLGTVAGPAQATLLVRSNSTEGLVIIDNNGLNDLATLNPGSFDGQPGYSLRNSNFGDVFDFDFGAGCRDGGDRLASCRRFISKVNVQLAGGNDHFSMGLIPASPTSVAASAGNDRVSGQPGADNLNGGTGDDKLDGLGGNDTLNGRDGADELAGWRGDDTINGDDGDDKLNGDLGAPDQTQVGADTLSGGAGNDDITSKEAEGATSVKDTVTCGSGQDFVTADLKDTVSATSDPGGGTCEEVDRSPVGETPHVRIRGTSLRVSNTGRVRVRLRCPRGVASLGCKGKLRLRIARGARSSASRPVRYRIKAGRSKIVSLGLTARDVRRLRSRQRRGRRIRGVLTSVERGRLGPKTTVRTPQLR
jgi:Ca2+-binding RTX toxin-like protein